jgi:hypothetical protein
MLKREEIVIKTHWCNITFYEMKLFIMPVKRSVTFYVSVMFLFVSLCNDSLFTNSQLASELPFAISHTDRNLRVTSHSLWLILTIYDYVYDLKKFCFHKKVQLSVSVGENFESNVNNIAILYKQNWLHQYCMVWIKLTVV